MAAAGQQKAQALFSCTDPDEWWKARNQHDSVMAQFARSGSAKAKYHAKYESLLARGQAGKLTSLTYDELFMVFNYKMTRNKFRPLKKLIMENGNTAVVQSTEKAFQLITAPDVAANSTTSQINTAMDSLAILSEKAKGHKLSGVGPALASLILPLVAPDIMCFMSEEVLMAVRIQGAKRHSKESCRLLLEIMTAARETLHANTGQEDQKLTLMDMERALWVVAVRGAARDKAAPTNHNLMRAAGEPGDDMKAVAPAPKKARQS